MLTGIISFEKLGTPFQSGFVQDGSTTYQLLHTYMYQTFCEAIDSGKEVLTVFCDTTKAFDRVWHKGLLHKLRRLGVSDQVLKWFTGYFTYLGVDNALSSMANVTTGPQLKPVCPRVPYWIHFYFLYI